MSNFVAKFGVGAAVVALVLGIIAVVWSVSAFILMLAYNFLAASFGWTLLNFWQVVAVVVVLSVVGSFFRSSSSSKSK